MLYKAIKVIQRAYESKEMRIFRGSEIRSCDFRLPTPILAHLSGKGMRLGMKVTVLSAGFSRAVIAGMIPPQASPGSSSFRVDLTNADS